MRDFRVSDRPTEPHTHIHPHTFTHTSLHTCSTQLPTTAYMSFGTYYCFAAKMISVRCGCWWQLWLWTRGTLGGSVLIMQLERVCSDGHSPLASLLVLWLPGSLWTWTLVDQVPSSLLFSYTLMPSVSELARLIGIFIKVNCLVSMFC